MCHLAASRQTKRCHTDPRGIAKLKNSGFRRSCHDTKKALNYRERAGAKSIGSGADGQQRGAEALGGRMEAGEPTAAEKTEDDC